MTRPKADALRRGLAQTAAGDFSKSAVALLAELGYRSDRRPPALDTAADAFFRALPAEGEPGRAEEAAFRDRVRSVEVLFQLTDDEIRGQTGSPFGEDRAAFHPGLARSFLFVAAELEGRRYTRGAYAEITRNIHRRFSMPVAVLFRTAAGLVTLAFVHRRKHRRKEARDVLGRVFLIREVHPTEPHRAHLDIVAALALGDRLEWMRTHREPLDFDGLLRAWLSALDTEELNRRFYRDLFHWFERAVAEAAFPTDGPRVLRPEEHVIRLVTRLMFVWFLKEKGLVAEELFAEAPMRGILGNDDFETGDSYYRAVLQNLFFATLNTEVTKRRFSRRTQPDHRNFSVYRYREEIADPDGLLELFDRTPFVNGGLFDCLDDFASRTRGGSRVDCFTDNPEHRRSYSIPDRLFFSGDPAAPGLFRVFDRYRFTVEESTPAEREVALDPELLGKVFENLLAAYNPESSATARKQTGSYYTPRIVVDYMVEEALAEALARKAAPEEGERGWWIDRLRYLLDHEDACDDAEDLFEPGEREALIAAVADLTVLDPAVGSGAFPMGVLHKLTLALRRLDPDNTRWERLQKQRASARAASAFDEPGKAARDTELMEVSAVFEQYRDSDYGRKLFLIQNTLFGVDLQPIACQIAKLRVFITLAIEQNPTGERSANYGIRPLPNLETRFLAADSLKTIRNGARMLGENGVVVDLESRLAHNRERHFHAVARTEKLECMYRNRELRADLAAALKEEGFAAGAADSVAAWDPYDQNCRADWFDPAYMFHRREGFDVVLGNPPYVESRSSMVGKAAKKAYGDQVESDWGSRIPRGSDLLVYFYARAAGMLKPDGLGAFITQNAWLHTDYGKKFQDFTKDRFSFPKIVDTSAKFFSDAAGPNINAVVTFFDRRPVEDIRFETVNEDMETVSGRRVRRDHPFKWGAAFSMPGFFEEVWRRLASGSASEFGATVGQGLNVPRVPPGEGPPAIHKLAQFVVVDADSAVPGDEASRRRPSRVPALILPRGVGARHWCAFNRMRAFSHSQVEVYLPEEVWDTDRHYALWAFLNSSVVWLCRELTGRSNLGGGLLKAEAMDLKAIPLGQPLDFGSEAKEILERLESRRPLPVAEEVRAEEHLALDDLVEKRFGIGEFGEEIRGALVERLERRAGKAKRRTGAR